MDGRTAADVLGVAPGASRQEITRAFRAQAKLAHPDTAGSHESFVALRAAYDHLAASAPATAHAPAAASGPSSRSWFSPAPATTPTIDRSDSVRPARASRARTATTPTGAGRRLRCNDRRDDQRDDRGWTFGDHLEALLASRH